MMAKQITLILPTLSLCHREESVWLRHCAHWYRRCSVSLWVQTFIACSHRRSGEDKTVLSCLSVSAVWTQLATRQDSFVLSWPSFQFATVRSHIYWGLLKTWKLETWSREDKTVLSCLQLCSHRRRGQDKIVLSCPFRRCKPAVTVHCCCGKSFDMNFTFNTTQSLGHLTVVEGLIRCHVISFFFLYLAS